MKKIFLFFAVVMLFTQCQKDKLDVNTNSVIDIEKLVEQSLKVIEDESEFELISEKFKSLSADELELFFDLAFEKRLEQNGDLQLPANKKDEVKALRKEVFAKAISEYGMSFNKLSEDQQQSVFQSLKDNTFFESNKAESCPIASYPYKSCRITSFDTYWSGYDRYATPSEPNDCDYEYRFYGWQTTTYGGTWFDRQLIDHWGSCGIARRYSAGYTRLLFGQKGVYFWIGYPGFFDVRMR